MGSLVEEPVDRPWNDFLAHRSILRQAATRAPVRLSADQPQTPADRPAYLIVITTHETDTSSGKTNGLREVHL